MSKVEATQFLLIIMVLAAAYTDIRFQKIPNKLALAGLLAGCLLSWLFGGRSGLVDALLGAAAGFGVMLLFHLFGAIGAGDVKLFAAVGALSGPLLTISIITYSILFAGVIGLGMLVRRKQFAVKGRQIMYAVYSFIFFKHKDTFISSRADMIRFPFLMAVVPGLAAAMLELWDKGGAVWML